MGADGFITSKSNVISFKYFLDSLDDGDNRIIYTVDDCNYVQKFLYNIIKLPKDLCVYIASFVAPKKYYIERTLSNGHKYCRMYFYDHPFIRSIETGKYMRDVSKMVFIPDTMYHHRLSKIVHDYTT